VLPRHYYVYAHYAHGWSDPFYIGKGMDKRAYVASNRSHKWKEWASKGYSVRIPVQNVPEVCAFCIERMMVAAFDRKNMANLSDGGAGGCGMRDKKHMDAARLRMSEVGKGRKKPAGFGAKISKSMKNLWSDPERKRIKSALRRSKAIYTFSHPERGEFTGTRYEFCVHIGVVSNTGNVSTLIKGRMKSYKGWKLA